MAKTCHSCAHNKGKLCQLPLRGYEDVNRWLVRNKDRRDKKNVPIDPDEDCPGWEEQW